MDHVDSSCQISLCICESVSDPGSPLGRVLARVYLVSDLVHNSTITSQKCYWWPQFTQDVPQVLRAAAAADLRAARPQTGRLARLPAVPAVGPRGPRGSLG